MELTPELLTTALAAVLGALVVVIIWPSVAFALLFSIPMLKVYLRSIAPALMESFTYDMTVACLAFVAAVVYRTRHGYGLRLNLPAGLVVCWFILMALMWLLLPASRDFEEGMKKALTFTFFGTVSCFSVAAYACSMVEVNRLLRVLIFLGVFSTVFMLLFGEGTEHYRGARQSFLGANFANVATACIILGLLLLGIWLRHRKMWQLVLVAISVPILVYCAIATGTRGALVAAPLGVLALLWFYRRDVNVKLIAGIPVVVIVAAVLIGRIVDYDMLLRFGGKEFERGWSDRTAMASVTWQGFLDNPIVGNGTGDVSYQLTGRVGAKEYTHNLVLEAANELGIVGVVAFLGLFWYALCAGWRLDRLRLEPAQKAIAAQVFACFVYSAIVNMKGGSYAHVATTNFLLVLTVLTERCLQQPFALGHQREPGAKALRHGLPATVAGT